jgi:hypothetical protein
MLDGIPGGNSGMSETDPKKPGFNPEVLDKMVIAIPLLKQLREEEKKAVPHQLHRVTDTMNMPKNCGPAVADTKPSEILSSFYKLNVSTEGGSAWYFSLGIRYASRCYSR